jgi:hypothetical protein
MAHKKRRQAPVPPGNRPQGGPPGAQPDTIGNQPNIPNTGNEGGFQEQDPKRRLGNYGGAGEHPVQQLGGKNDANH